ncbi:MAG: Ig-like domain repeat protein [Terriglobales bacterium]
MSVKPLVVLLLAASTLSAALTRTATTLTAAPNPSSYGEAVTFTALVKPAPPNGETVSFTQGPNTLGTGILSGGTATCMTSAFTPGTYTIKATYAGDGIYGSSTSNAVKQVVEKLATTTTLVSSQNPVNFGVSLTFTATVTAQPTGTPTGTVSFYNGSTKLGNIGLSNGVANYTTTKLPAGTDSITAVYDGGTLFATSTSNIVTETVTGGCGTGTFNDLSMTWNNVTRYYEVYLPANLPASLPPAMVLMLHGTRTTVATGADPEPIISLNWGWQAIADQYCFILVKPASTYDPSTHQWNWNAYCMDGTEVCAPYGSNGGAFPYAEGCGSSDGECPDDIGFLGQLIQNLTVQYGVNPSMVYVAGFSSGAEMTERVGVELSGLVTAIVPGSGQLVAEQGIVPPSLPVPTLPIPFVPTSVQEWQGTEDDVLPPCGYGTTKYNAITFTLDTVDDTFNYWVQANGCTTLQTTAPLCLNGAPNYLNDAPTPGMPGLTGNVATGCTNNVVVQFVWEPSVGHSWQQQYDINRWNFFIDALQATGNAKRQSSSEPDKGVGRR